jgi:molybdate transport system substrate-binding protein
MRIWYFIIVAGFIGLLCISCDTMNHEEKNYTIFAAAGTREATEEICDLFEQKYCCSVSRNYASSGMLARQIDKGAMADIYISANKQWVDYLVNKKILIDSTVRSVAGTGLVVVAPIDNADFTFKFKPEFDVSKVVPNRIAIGNPGHVPVGFYAETALRKLDWLKKLDDKVLLAKDVSSILHYVELGECDWGVVYYTEAIKSKKVKIVAEIPADLHDPVMFYIGNVKHAQSGSHQLNAYFNSGTGNDVLTKNGFSLIHSYPKTKDK